MHCPGSFIINSFVESPIFPAMKNSKLVKLQATASWAIFHPKVSRYRSKTLLFMFSMFVELQRLNTDSVRMRHQVIFIMQRWSHKCNHSECYHLMIIIVISAKAFYLSVCMIFCHYVRFHPLTWKLRISECEQSQGSFINSLMHFCCNYYVSVNREPFSCEGVSSWTQNVH